MNKIYNAKSNKKRVKNRLFTGVFFSGLLILGIAYGWFHATIVSDLPNISEIEDVVFNEATIITDRHGQQLYKLFQENREYVPIEDISQHMINAIIAVEDQKFWTNKGIDMFGMLRAAINNIFSDELQGASTITQQLVKNLVLSNEKTITRKLKEVVLTQKLHTNLKNDLKKEHNNLTNEDLQRKMKQKILEMYLNYIFLGQNAYGVQAAARTYFNTNAKDLTPLQAAIIASLPKSPSTLNPFKNRERLMGQLRIRKNGSDISPVPELTDTAANKVNEALKNINFDKKDKGSFVKTIIGVTDFTLTFEGTTYQVTYEPGRKDFSLMNMYDEGYIDQFTLKQSFVQGLIFKFEQGKIEIKAPHFVHWIQERLEKEYDQETLMKGGLVVKTTLDYKIQQRAEQAVEKNYNSIRNNGGNNAGLVYLNSDNGDVLAYVGSIDYFNDDPEKGVDGKVDMVRALRQPGSSIKPFIYALGFQKLPLTLDTPIFDTPITLAGKRPSNFDGDFLGLLPLKQTLGFSRNIGPIKMFLAVGGEKVVKPYLQALGLNSLKEGMSYGYPLSIGAGEIQMLELANAYMHLSAAGEPAVINPILEIRTNEGAIVYQKNVSRQKKIIPKGIASLIRTILSDRQFVPADWVSSSSIRGLVTAIKSGTTDVKVTQNGRSRTLPRDAWLASYTPSRVAIFRAGNTKGAPMEPNAYGLKLNGPIRKDFFSIMLANNYIPNETFPVAEVKNITVNKITGKIATADTPETLKADTKAYIHSIPANDDRAGEIIQYDTLCEGKRTPLVPPTETANGIVWQQPTSFMPDQRDVQQIKERFAQSTGYFLQAPDTVCDERVGTEDENIAIEILKPTNAATTSKMFELRYNVQTLERNVKYVRVYLNDIVVAEQAYDSNNVTDIIQIAGYAGFQPGEHLLTLEAVDTEGYFNKARIGLYINETDSTLPYLLTDKIRVETDEAGVTTIYLLFADDESIVKGGTITIGEEVINFEGNLISTVLPSGASINYTVSDIYTNTLQGTLAWKDLQ